MTRKLVTLALIAAVLWNAGPGTGWAEEAPYRGYTYSEWGKPVPSPNGYLPDKLVTGAMTGAGDFKAPQSMFVDRTRNELYVVDTGNNRLVVLDARYEAVKELAVFDHDGKEETLNGPTDVFVSDDGLLYIADRGNQRIVVSDAEGNIKSLFGKPVSDLLPEGFIFQPDKLVVDKAGIIYVQAFGVFQGLISLYGDGTFLNYFGGNRVDVTAKVLLEMVWKRLLTKSQRDAMQSFVPIEYSNLYIDREDFIYTTVRTSENSLNELKKLNPLGINILRANSNRGYAYRSNDYGDHPVVYVNGQSKVDSVFVDIHVDELGYITALDSTRGKLFQYDQESNLMFVFGARGDQKGAFKDPVAVERWGDRLIVLDAAKNNITAFSLTSFGAAVRQALTLYNDGLYQEALQPWHEVLNRDSNYLLAYVGLGKAYFQMEDYQNAMKYFKLGYAKDDYSDAFKAYYTELLRRQFDAILLAMIGLVALYHLLKRRKRIAARFHRHKHQQKGGIPG